MAKAFETPPGVDIAALKNKKTSGPLDLMRPGDGTPWEDRGAQGVVKAFFQTCVKSITSPALLLDHIRRPDTTNEARNFAIGCCGFWAVSVAVHMILWDMKFRPLWWERWEQVNEGVYANQFYIKVTILSLVMAALVFVLMVQFANRMYFALVSTELKNAAPAVLLYNMFCYCLGPSILALIPVAGPPLALLMIFIAWCVGGAKRLFITWRGAIVAAVLTFGAVIIMAGVAWYVLGFVLNQVTGLVEPPPPDPKAGGGTGR